MLYLVQPFSPLQWEDMPATRAILEEAAKRDDVDLARLEWKPSDQPVSSDVIGVALRHGVRCSTGIVLQAIDVITLRRPQELRDSHARVQQAHAAVVPQEALIDKIFPGWIEHGKELDARVAESTREAIREAEGDVAELLSAPMKLDLVQHWQSLGGRVPDAA